MSRGNILLLGALIALAGAWLLGRDWERDKPSGPAPRLFPDFSRSAADRIEISGGSSGTAWTFARKDSGWVLVSAGDFAAKATEADRFLDAVASLRKDNEVGKSDDLRQRSMTDEKGGRLVRVLDKDGKALAAFYVGKKPEREYSGYFVRRADDSTIYRTQTLLTKDREAEVSSDPYAAASGFSWNDYLNDLSARWVDPTVWDLGGAEVEEIWLGRPGHFNATLKKQAQDKWELVEEGKEPVAADADVADGILSVVRRLSLYDVLGAYDENKPGHGLDKPELTLILTLKKKVEKPAPKEGEPEPTEGEEPKEEYVTFKRTIEVGEKITRSQYDEYTGETKPVDYYAIHVGPKGDVPGSSYVFLVRDYVASQIRKDLTDLVAKPKEEEKGPGDEEGEGAEPEAGEQKPAEQKPGEEKPADEKAGEEKPGDAEPAEEKPAEEKPGGGEEPAGGEKEGCGDKDAGCGEGCGCGDEDPGCGEDEGCGKDR